MQPRIGILRAPYGLDRRYAVALREAGATPVPLAPDVGLDGLAGLLVPGGGDFLPPRPYPDGVHFDRIPEAQLARDEARLAAALARRLPVLGICFGMQLLAKLAGGRFVYDLATERPAAESHQLPPLEGRHGIAIAPGSRLAALLRATHARVNSSHHQAVLEPGRGLRVVARADDGVVEAVESPDPERFVLGVQWHPERMPPGHRSRLFPPFVAAALRKGVGPRSSETPSRGARARRN
jgi:putative glutamine amidotransferase